MRRPAKRAVCVDRTLEHRLHGAGTAYVNVLAVKEGRESDPAIQALAKALCSDEVKAFIDETYAGAVQAVF